MLVRILLVLALLLALGPPVGHSRRAADAYNMSSSAITNSDHLTLSGHHSAQQESGQPELRPGQLGHSMGEPLALPVLTNNEDPTPRRSGTLHESALSRSRPQGSKVNQPSAASQHSVTASVPLPEFSSLSRRGNNAEDSSSSGTRSFNSSVSLGTKTSASETAAARKTAEENQRRRKEERRRAKQRRQSALYQRENFVIEDRNKEQTNFNEGTSLSSGNNGSKPLSQGRQSLTNQPSSDGKDNTGSASSSSSSLSDGKGKELQNDGRNPYRHMGEDDKDVTDKMRPAFWSGDIQVGCRELRARRYITDGFCTSEKPIKEVVCAGHCLPIMEMPWYAEFIKTLARTKLREYQCVEDLVRKKRVRLLCQNGELRFYRIKVVKSCKCKRIVRKHNRTAHGRRNGKKRRKQRRRRKDRKNKRGRVS